LKKQRGLVVIYDPHALMQFLQFYCMDNHRDIEWDVLCLPKEDGRQEMDGYCEKTGIFNRIYVSDVEFKSLSIMKKLKLFIPMMFYALFGKQKTIVRKIYNSMVEDIDAYDYYAANTESGFMSGMMASFAKEKKTVFFEDGSADYLIERKKWKSYYKNLSFDNFQCILMAKLGYFGKGYTYFEPTKNCYKYASIPEELSYKNYRQIFRFELDEDQNEHYKALLNKLYPEVDEYKNIPSGCNLVFTIPLSPDNAYKNEFVEKFQEYINTHSTEIYLKRHPRDTQQYTFSDRVTVHEIPQNIPAEVIFPYFKGNYCYMMEPDSLLLNMSSFDFYVNVLFCQEYVSEERRLHDNWRCKEAFDSYCKRFVKDKYEITDL